MIEILPYSENAISDEVIEETFKTIIKDNLYHIVFYDGTIKTEEDFRQLIKEKNNFALFGFVDRRLAGVAWVNALYDNHASPHFCIFREFWGRYSQSLGRRAIDCWFSIKNKYGKHLLDILTGVTPSEYKHAVRYISRLGFIVIGELPYVGYNALTKKYGSVTLSYIERPCE
ncbi:MAG: hypothetical protein PHE50_00025 [Dehalococcoidales bacterium]|nr:hypothetical protein [Dehalococcoidales bacterium]